MGEQLVKGTGIIPVREYIKEKFGDETLKKILNRMPKEYQEYFENLFDVQWYPLEILSTLYTLITEEIGKGDPKVCWEVGRYTAEYGLNKIYKFFLRLGSIKLFVNKGHAMYSTYYKGSELKILKYEENYIEIQIIGIKTSDSHLYSIGGWMEKAGELVGAKNVKVEIDIKDVIYKIHYD
uniref:DUF2378 family protein n=1 Tax=candidate division WOR-3 bacterium TaxID=2052148 RepID=A0A7C4Y446_UNCW3